MFYYWKETVSVYRVYSEVITPASNITQYVWIRALVILNTFINYLVGQLNKTTKNANVILFHRPFILSCHTLSMQKKLWLHKLSSLSHWPIGNEGAIDIGELFRGSCHTIGTMKYWLNDAHLAYYMGLFPMWSDVLDLGLWTSEVVNTLRKFKQLSHFSIEHSIKSRVSWDIPI